MWRLFVHENAEVARGSYRLLIPTLCPLHFVLFPIPHVDNLTSNSDSKYQVQLNHIPNPPSTGANVRQILSWNGKSATQSSADKH